MLHAPKTLPSRDLLPLATTVERVYDATPTWAVAALIGLGLALAILVGNYRDNEVAQAECVALYGANHARCAQ
jgi:hypothetical protein